MKNDLPCNIIKDLLPVYLDGIASEETNICVKNHLKECQLCQNEYEKLREDIKKKDEAALIKEYSLIKTIKKRILISFIVITIIGIALTSLAMFCCYIKAMYDHSKITDMAALLPIYIGMYYLPLLAMLAAVVWKKTIAKAENAFWQNVIISFLGIAILIEIFLLLSRSYFFLLHYL